MKSIIKIGPPSYVNRVVELILHFVPDFFFSSGCRLQLPIFEQRGLVQVDVGVQYLSNDVAVMRNFCQNAYMYRAEQISSILVK